jgi:DNA mismatch repair protein MutL
MLATLACKSALKAGQFLTIEQRQKLVKALTEKHYAYTCPHGRPVKIEISLPKLMQMFKR